MSYQQGCATSGVASSRCATPFVVRKVFEFQAYVHAALVDVYDVSKRLVEALKVFDGMPVKNVVSRNVMITGFVGWVRLSMRGFCLSRCPAAMLSHGPGRLIGIRPNRVTFLSVIDACSHGGLMEQGKYGEVEMGERAIKKILDLERECGGDFAVLSNIEAGEVNVMSNSFSSFTRSSCNDGSCKEAPCTFWPAHLSICHRQLDISFASKTFAKTYAHKEGEQMHIHVIKFGFLLDIFVSNSLIHLYVACGDLVCARSVFNDMLVKDVVSWNSLTDAQL
ncbi:unnamed protein product [Miscanthus lutarioriparius]|uniref:Pentatricopeptide repeat-containing protein n=1 Tax=Miscanthus lutarioriparius TaxID=422564 RepID=A0A811PSG0_9POAL|nr:unnamed protein product [Miscanthus lutarioriparius]